MPFCTTCGEVFEGLGSHCPFHNPYLFTNNLDSSDRDIIKYRTGHGRRHKHGALKYYDSYDDQALVPYRNPQSQIAISNHALRDTAHTFSRLTSDYAINNMTLSLHPSGTKSISVSANKDREQCPICRQWFSNSKRLDKHKWEFPSGCEVHEMCFGREEEHFHGTSWKHDRCFVKGCTSLYRMEGGWKTKVVEGHVREWHWRQ